MNSLILPIVAAVALAILSFTGVIPPYPLHIVIVIMIWSFTYTSWALMGRFGLVSRSWAWAPM